MRCEPQALWVAVALIASGLGGTPSAWGESATSCGNGATEAGEACDGGSIACSALGGSWSAGLAACKTSCTGWDVSTCTLGAPGNIEVVKPAVRDPARWAQARCNDGTPFAFRLSLAPTPSPVWVIQLEGGGYCDDATLLCAERETRLTTTLPLADRGTGPLATQGIFSRDVARNPTFAGANHVFAHYCSSDFWHGATTDLRPSAVSPGGWYYSGRANVRAMFEVLAQRYGLDDENPALEVLFGGNSAGAFGAQFNSLFVAEALPKTRTAGRLKLLLDAPWFLDWDDPANRIVNATVRDREVWRSAQAYWGATGDPECEASVDDPIDCWFGATWYPFVSARQPTFVQISQLDEVIGLEIHPTLAADEAASDAWRAQVGATTANVAWLFSGTEPYHVLTISDRGWATGPPGSTLREMVSRFFDDGPPERVTFVGPLGSCVPSATALCLNGGRFRVEADWETKQGAQGAAQAVELTADTGLFWFFSSDNVEAVVKVLDGCAVNQRYWVFAGGLTNVRTEITVTDTATGAVKTYVNPQRTAFLPIQDTNAFAACPESGRLGTRATAGKAHSGADAAP